MDETTVFFAIATPIALAIFREECTRTTRDYVGMFLSGAISLTGIAFWIMWAVVHSPAHTL